MVVLEKARLLEEHVDWLETQLHRIKHVGLENYLAEQMGGHDA